MKSLFRRRLVSYTRSPVFTQQIKSFGLSHPQFPMSSGRSPLIPTKDYHGAARLREKTPEEVAAERDARKITA